MKDNITFSIIIPTFNCEELIKNTLDSIIAQDNNLYECIIIDGLSKDKTVDIIEQYVKKNSNIRYISEKDSGIYDAMNKGICLARGKYLYFIGVGDRLCRNALDNIYRQIDDEDFVYGNVYFDYERIKEGGELKKIDLVYSCLCHQAIFYKRDIFNLVGKYDFKYKIVADNMLNKKIFADDNISKKYIDIDVAHFLGGGASQGFNIISDFKDENHYADELIEIFNRSYLRDAYKCIDSITNRRLIAWGIGGEYLKAQREEEFQFDYFVKSDAGEGEMFENRKVKNRELLLTENKKEIFVLVYSAYFYKDIKKWLEKNNFIEYENFMLVTKEIIILLKRLNLL
jgi:glycosyltransferase involved in cell wall biosynthesis